MADQIRLDFDQLAQIAQRLYALGNKLNRIGSEINGVHIDAESGGRLKAGVSCYLSGVGYAVNSADIAGALGQLARAAGRVGDRASAISGGVNKATELFTGVERGLMQTLDGDDGGQWQKGGAAGDNFISQMIANFFSTHKSRRPTAREVFSFFKGLNLPGNLAPAVLAAGGGMTLLYTDYKVEGTAKGSWKPSDLKIEPDSGDNSLKYTYDPETGELTETPKDATYRDQMTLMAFGVSASASQSLLHSEAETQIGNLTLKGSSDFLKVEEHASIEGGLYSYKTGPDGKTYRTFSPGIKGEMGASFSVLEADVSAEYELIDNVSVGTKGYAEFLSASTTASFGLGVVENGLMGSVKLDAEMNLAKAGGDLHMDVGGIKGSIGGDVSIGIGAHANVGFEKGKFNFDIGFGIGIGASVRGEIDVSGFIDNTIEAAGDFISGASHFFGSLFG